MWVVFILSHYSSSTQTALSGHLHLLSVWTFTAKIACELQTALPHKQPYRSNSPTTQTTLPLKQPYHLNSPTAQTALPLKQLTTGAVVAEGLPVVTRFFWPPLIPRIIWLPTGISAHTCNPSAYIQSEKQRRGMLSQQTLSE